MTLVEGCDRATTLQSGSGHDKVMNLRGPCLRYHLEAGVASIVSLTPIPGTVRPTTAAI
jgi:hypothetical protein